MTQTSGLLGQERPMVPGIGGMPATLVEPREHAKTDTVQVSLVIPALNEVAGIAGTIREAKAIFKEHDIEWEILVVDDGSEDSTAEMAAVHGATVVRHAYTRGYGNALRTGILEARHPIIAICDADGTYPMDRIPDLVEKLESGYDLVVGARQGKHFSGSAVKGVARRVFHRMCESATGTTVPDANSGLRVFRRAHILPYLPMMCSGFSFTTSQTLCYLSLNHLVTFVPIDYKGRIGRSKVRHLVDSLRTAQYIFQMYTIFNPVKLFTLLSFIPALFAILLFVGSAGAEMVGYVGAFGAAMMPTTVLGCFSLLVFALGLAVFGSTRQTWPYVECRTRAPAPGRLSRERVASV